MYVLYIRTVACSGRMHYGNLGYTTLEPAQDFTQMPAWPCNQKVVVFSSHHDDETGSCKAHTKDGGWELRLHDNCTTLHASAVTWRRRGGMAVGAAVLRGTVCTVYTTSALHYKQGSWQWLLDA